MEGTTNGTVQLFTYPNSPFGAKVYWALQYKQTKFELTYVNPLSRREIAFTKQGMVPILKVGDAWLQDSSETCLWLEELYPQRPFSGESIEQKQLVIEADKWVTDNVVALHFRACIDSNDSQSTKRNAMRMANVILPATESMAPWLKKTIIPFWPFMLRHTGFVKRAAHRLDPNRNIQALHDEVATGFDKRIENTGFLAGTDHPSFADIGAFAEIAFCTTHDFEGTLNELSSTAISSWYERMCSYFPSSPAPSLFPNWPPAGFNLSDDL